MVLGPDVPIPTKGKEHDDGLDDVEQDPAQRFINATSIQYENDEDDDVVEVVQAKKTLVHEVINLDDDDGVAPAVASQPKTSGPASAPTPNHEPRPGPSSLSQRLCEGDAFSFLLRTTPVLQIQTPLLLLEVHLHCHYYSS